MADNTSIEWADSTFNPWIGCTKVGPGCDNCYAEADFDLRKHRAKWGPGNPRSRTAPANWKKPLQWDRQHAEFFAAHGRRRRVFCASLADVFDNEVPDEWRADLIILIESTPHLDWLLLTKRIGNVERMVEEATDLIDYGEGWQSMWGQGKWPDHVWLGATICNQDEADRDIRKLLSIPAQVRFISAEPLLGAVDVRPYLRNIPCYCHPQHSGLHPCIDWVVVGGESGHNARPMHPQWARDLRDQCAAAGVPFLFKQWGEWTPGVNVERRSGTVKTADWFGNKWVIGKEDLAYEDGHADDEPDLYLVGKKAAGRLLDGKLHDGYPDTP